MRAAVDAQIHLAMVIQEVDAAGSIVHTWNSADHMDPATETTSLSTAEDYAHINSIRVMDDGPGVPKEIRRTLFEPGFTTKRGGWGIGLALSRRVVEDAHRGSLLLETTDKGACFLMRVPLAESAG